MPDHVSAAQPVELTSAWTGRYHWWDAYFAVAGLGVVPFALLTAPSVAAGLGSAALLAGIAVLYVLVGRRTMRDHDEGWVGVLYVVGAFLLYAPAVALVTGASFALFALCPQCYMALPPRWALPATIGFFGVHLVLFLVVDGDAKVFLTELLPLAVVIVTLSAIFGTWSDRVLSQSEERAALIRELAASRAEVERLGMLAERQRLAAEIHDTIAQGLSSVVMLVQAALAEADRARAEGHLTLALDTARDNLEEARALVAGLTPALLDGGSLADAIRRLAPDVEVHGRIRSLSTGVDVVLLRAAQEALTNARKHATGAAAVELCYGSASVALTVRDGGPGFDPAAASTGYGLSGMRSRVAQVGGALTVTSAPGSGTAVRVEVPA